MKKKRKTREQGRYVRKNNHSGPQVAIEEKEKNAGVKKK